MLPKYHLAAAIIISASPVFAQTAEPDPMNLPAVVDWILETNACSASESQIYEAIVERTDMSTAQAYFRIWTEGPDFSKKYRSDRNADGSFSYTLLTGQTCGT
ncbi:hypothetical protein FNJ84_09360 [Paracoccus sp. M683]|uniref:hypothetical protein n=1 Tax=Paracoccus sp. M683 TaxID=2594268 RepID=UPI001180C04B|nr:hypothetical protein [Paracoccus sp. M683]TRW97688.1 hypothetical protein FNJ84_09360 [Paracoccus sp. M683]